MEKPRDINQALVDAYLARRALDYLVGFTYHRCCGANCKRGKICWARPIRGLAVNL